MAESHVVSALVNKRAEIAGLISRTERQLGQFRADLVHLDATLRLFAPELEPKAIPAKRIRQPDRWFEQGELPRRVLDAVRRAGGPCQARHLSAKGGHDAVDPFAGKISKHQKFFSAVSQRLSKQPIWLGEAATSSRGHRQLNTGGGV